MIVFAFIPKEKESADADHILNAKMRMNEKYPVQQRLADNVFVLSTSDTPTEVAKEVSVYRRRDDKPKDCDFPVRYVGFECNGRSQGWLPESVWAYIHGMK